jgi:hypothetical protein
MDNIKTIVDAFAGAAFLLLGIERFLYGYVYHFPGHFKRCCKEGVLGSKIQNEPVYWKNFMQLGMYVKVFQYSVVLYDLFIRCTMNNPIVMFLEADRGVSFAEATAEAPWSQFLLGLSLVCLGQFLNVAVFQALGAVGVYYGCELGYKVNWCMSFPYNIPICDPQYWGVIICIWGIYIAVGASSLLVPVLETFWYGMSMKLIEHSNGKKLLDIIC